MQDIMKKEGDSPKEKWAVIAFTDGARLPWLKLLKPGFRHCLVSVCDGVHWLTVDPMLHKTEVAVQPVAASFDLAAWYRDLGFVVVETALFSPPLKSAPLGIFSCVEAVKRILGIHARLVVTPWQLYNFLQKTKNRKIVLDNWARLG